MSALVSAISGSSSFPYTYNLKTAYDIYYNGFENPLPDTVLDTLRNLIIEINQTKEVTIQLEVKKPVFPKREPPKQPPSSGHGGNKHGNNSTNSIQHIFANAKRGSSSISTSSNDPRKRKPKNATEMSEEEWKRVQDTFHATKLEKKTGIDAQMGEIRTHINKITDKNYEELLAKIINIIDDTQSNPELNCEQIATISNVIFDIASSNKFSSKTYAKLYASLCSKYEHIKNTCNENVSRFADLFSTIEYVDPDVNYDRYCEVNKINEKRKSIALFYTHLMDWNIISLETLNNLSSRLLTMVFERIDDETKRNEVDELINVIVLLPKISKKANEDEEVDDDNVLYPLICGYTIEEAIQQISTYKTKDHKGLSSKSIFKIMDWLAGKLKI